MVMIVGLKKSIFVVVYRFPETSITGEWIGSKLDYCLTCLAKEEFKVRRLVTDNHSENVTTFPILINKYPSDNPLCIQHPDNVTNTYLFFDNIQLMKSICNNLLNASKFVFPEFSLQIMKDREFTSVVGYLCWSDLHAVCDGGVALQANLRKAPKLTFAELHPDTKKQNVALALAVFHETPIAAVKSYFPQRKDVADFLALINSWRTIIMARTQYCNNSLANAFVAGDGKTEFFICKLAKNMVSNKL